LTSLSLVFKWREDTSNSCCDYVQYIQSADNSPSHEQEVLKKEYYEVEIKKCYTGQNLISFVAKRESIDNLCKNELFSFFYVRQ
jgi:hypothetical protein